MFVFLGLLLPVPLFAQDSGIETSVNISVDEDLEIWAGQQVTLNLDLKTTGFSFSNTLFNLPEVSGAFLMQTDTTTIKSSERIDGKDWQIVRYPLALYPQKSGQLQVPGIDVRFTSSAGFGSAAESFEFQTETLQLTIKLPPGVGQGDLVVSTTSFQLEHEWQPASGTANTGDAITLTVTRRASDISAMLLPPLPVFRTQGLAAYPRAPEVEDKTDRGDLTGERVDSITWVVEEPGVYEIPGVRFQWWDPVRRELKQQIIPGRRLDIAPSQEDLNATGPDSKPESKPSSIVALYLSALVLFLGVGLWLRFSRRTSEPGLIEEKSAFATLQKACTANQATQAHSAIHAWLALSPVAPGMGSRTVTLGEFARSVKDKQLTMQLQELEEAVVSSDHQWRGDGLLSSLKQLRGTVKTQKTNQSREYLAPLNP
jgi:hypothetical protein